MRGHRAPSLCRLPPVRSCVPHPAKDAVRVGSVVRAYASHRRVTKHSRLVQAVKDLGLSEDALTGLCVCHLCAAKAHLRGDLGGEVVQAHSLCSEKRCRHHKTKEELAALRQEKRPKSKALGVARPKKSVEEKEAVAAFEETVAGAATVAAAVAAATAAASTAASSSSSKFVNSAAAVAQLAEDVSDEEEDNGADDDGGDDDAEE